MKKMGFSSDGEKYKKPKLPRKRKKDAIKSQGRKWYRDTIMLHKITSQSGKFYEPTCKFWVNSEIKMEPHTLNGEIRFFPTPSAYW